MNIKSDNNNEHQQDTLKQLEDLLAKDARSSSTAVGGFIPRLFLTGLLIRITVFTLLIVILWLIGIYDEAWMFSVSYAVFAALEGVRLYTFLKDQRKNQGKHRRK